jgi:tetratricopeptide (TPR) repeat protein
MRTLSLLLILMVSGVAFAADPPPADKPVQELDLERPGYTYQTCLDLARKHPDKAVEFSGRWVGLGGGEAAKHCQALALVGVGEYGEGATRLEALAQASHQPAGVRANMLAQAGQAWVMQDDLTRAYAAQVAALKMIPQGTKQHVEILMDRAGTLADAGKYDDALNDLDTALKIDLANADAWAFRAAASRAKGDIHGALKDAEHAVSAGPNNVSALLERGNLYRLTKRLPEARQDWLHILELDPKSAAADAARTNIERMDVDTRKR